MLNPFRKLERPDGPPIWVNPAFVTQIEPRHDGNNLVSGESVIHVIASCSYVTQVCTHWRVIGSTDEVAKIMNWSGH